MLHADKRTRERLVEAAQQRLRKCIEHSEAQSKMRMYEIINLEVDALPWYSSTGCEGSILVFVMTSMVNDAVEQTHLVRKNLSQM